MDLSPFYIEILQNNDLVIAEIKPCCNQDNAFYYDVHINNQFQFTLTQAAGTEQPGWRVALKNADKNVPEDIIAIIGNKIEAHFAA